jgi:membrane protein implicated in regulation of membrane protease activity
MEDDPMTRVVVDLKEWLLSLPPDFALLLMLPFVLALAWLLRHWACRARDKRRALTDGFNHRRSL